jgi:diguanylate cyclase (GGDEF)-like protein
MRSFRDTPIKRKLIAISLLSSGAALLLACGGFVAYELTAYREATLNQLTSVASVIASNSSSALSFDDPEAAEHSLSALRSERMVVAACIYGADQQLFAAYYSSAGQERCAVRHESEASEPRDGLDVSMPISGEGDALGTIVIRSRPIDLYERLARYGGILGLVMLFSGLASLPLASKLQRFISEPILQLVEASKRVSADKDFSARAVSNSHDEVGVLVESFNEMLEQIEERDQALSRHRENLEAEVERRTGELRSVNSKLTREIAQRQQAEERIRDLAYYDGLTGLPNRQLFQERLRRSLEWAQRQHELVGLLFLDLDRFKQVNDTLGHSAGDELLRKVSDRMHNSVRLGDYVGRPDLREPEGEVSRLGGDEFTVLLTRLSASEDAAKVAQRVLDELAKPIPVGGYELYTTASIGIALYPADGEDLETLLRNADTAMYHAKSRNGNNYQFYTEAMNVSAARKLLLASRLRHALEHGELAVHYQPIRDAVTGAVCAAEALLRWHEPEAGPVRPDEFIPIAEDSGLILSIGEWVLRSACTQVRAWQTQGFEAIRISVNVSTHQLRQPGWPRVVARVLEETGLSPAHLELELTESAILDHEDATIGALAELHEMGVSLALDDFGTGYSSLSSLRRFPIERVKIDRSFVGDITADPDDAALTTAILSMAQSLELRVVAEGVETLEQAEFLRARGCHELQGFLFSAAVTAAEFVRFLVRTKAEVASDFGE